MTKIVAALDVREILDAAWQAVAEGEAIVRRAHEQFGFQEHTRAGPLEAAWQRGEIGQGQPDPPEPEGDYYLTDQDRHDIDGVRTMLRMARLTRKPGLRNASYHAAGLHLLNLQRSQPEEWARIVQRECSLSKSRASELIAAATGKKPLAKARSETSARVRKHKNNQKHKRAKTPEKAAS
jgi:hypothetical protein